MKRMLPNIITLLNLASGVIAVLFAAQNELVFAAYFILAGIVFDFFDGFVARILHVQSELGVQLDSLADMVTSGVAPGIIMFQLLRHAETDWSMTDYLSNFNQIDFLPFLGIVITLAAAYRLAKFNIDENQTHDFIGVPTPAMTLFVLSIPIITQYGQQEWAKEIVSSRLFLIIVVLLGSFLMNANISLFSLKFKTISLKDNAVKYVLIVLSVLLLIVFRVTAIPLIILLYILLSGVNNVMKRV